MNRNCLLLLFFGGETPFSFSNKPISVSCSNKPMSVSGLPTQPAQTSPAQPSPAQAHPSTPTQPGLQGFRPGSSRAQQPSPPQPPAQPAQPSPTQASPVQPAQPSSQQPRHGSKQKNLVKTFGQNFGTQTLNNFYKSINPKEPLNLQPMAEIPHFGASKLTVLAAVRRDGHARHA